MRRNEEKDLLANSESVGLNPSAEGVDRNNGLHSQIIFLVILRFLLVCHNLLKVRLLIRKGPLESEVTTAMPVFHSYSSTA